MRPFDFHKPQSLDEALAIVSRVKSPRFLAGGQTLLPKLRENVDTASDIVLIEPLLPKTIELAQNCLEIGAGVTHAVISAASLVQNEIPALAKMASEIGDLQIRNRGTIGGALAANDPASEYSAAILACEAVIVTNQREIAASEFLDGANKTVLDASEIILKVRFNPVKAAAYAKFLDPAAQWPMVGVMVARTTDTWQIAVTGAHSQGSFRHSGLEKMANNRTRESGGYDDVNISSEGFRDTPFGDPLYRANLVSVLFKKCMVELG